MYKAKLKLGIIILGILTVLLGGYNLKLYRDSKKIKEIVLNMESLKNESVAEKVKLSFYVPVNNSTKLQKVSQDVEYTTKKDEVVRILIEVFNNKALELGTITEPLVLKNVFFSGKDIYLNFEENNAFKKDEKKVLYLLYSITNSIVDLGGVDRVKFLIGGKEEKGVLSQYYTKNTDL